MCFDGISIHSRTHGHTDNAHEEGHWLWGSCKCWMPANRQQHWSHFLHDVFTAADINMTVCGMLCFYPEDGAQSSLRNVGTYLHSCIMVHTRTRPIIHIVLCVNTLCRLRMTFAIRCRPFIEVWVRNTASTCGIFVRHDGQLLRYSAVCIIQPVTYRRYTL